MENDRLTVQYSIRADEMETEIKRLIYRSLSKLENLNEQFHQESPLADKLVDENDINGLLKFINNIRDQLAEVDYALNECASVAHGHHTYLTNKILPPSPAPAQPAAPTEEVDVE